MFFVKTIITNVKKLPGFRTSKFNGNIHLAFLCCINIAMGSKCLTVFAFDFNHDKLDSCFKSNNTSMKRLFNLLLLISLLFATSSAGVVTSETPPSATPVADATTTSEPTKKSIYDLSKKELKKISVADMEKMLGRKMTSLERTAYRLNKKKFVEFNKMAENEKTNTMAIVGFVSSLVIPVLGLIFGLIALGQIKKRGEKGKGWAIAAVVIGAVGTVIGIVAFL
jgi:hypothetical protein